MLNLIITLAFKDKKVTHLLNEKWDKVDQTCIASYFGTVFLFNGTFFLL